MKERPRPPKASSGKGRVLKIHVISPELAAISGSLHLWCWNVSGKELDVRALKGTEDHATFEIPLRALAKLGRPGQKGLGLRLKSGPGIEGVRWFGADMTWTRADGFEVYMAPGDPSFHASPKTLNMPRLRGVFHDTSTSLEVDFDRPVQGAGDTSTYRLEPPVPIHGVRVESPSRVHLETAPLSLHQGYTLVVNQPGGELRGGIMPRGVLEGLAPKGRLGAWIKDGRTYFTLFAPRAASVTLELHLKPQAMASERHPLRLGRDGVWSTSVPGDRHGSYYRYRVDGPQGLGESFNKDVPLNDPYALIALSSLGGEAGPGMVFDTNRLSPKAMPSPHPLESLVIYECHIRDLTQGAASGLRPQDPRRGKYLGAALPGLRSPEGFKTGLDHLVELGVNALQLLPVHEFPWRGDRYNWGYFTANFFSPAGVYASQEEGEARALEMLELVNACHERGIAVILDVVFNHSAEGSHEGPTMNLRGLDSKYYYRQDPASFHFYNGSGVGNELATERPVARRLVIDACLHWVKHFGIDGFRFDLMSLIDLETIARLKEALPEHIYVYGEPWAASRARWGRGALNELGRMGVFNDAYRDALKGDPEGREWGFIQGAGNVEELMGAISGNTRDYGAGHAWASRPIDGIQYLTCHDNLTLFDKLQVSLGDGSPGGAFEEEIRSRMRLAFTLQLTSLGPILLHGGVEMLRTKPFVPGHDGRAVPVLNSDRLVDANTYQGLDRVNNLDWRRKARYRKEFDYLRGLIALRKSPAGAPLNRAETPGDDALSFFKDPRNRCALAYRHGRGEGPQVAVAINASKEHPARFPFPFEDGRPWRLVADGHRVNLEGLEFHRDFDGGITLHPLGQLVFTAG